MKCQSHFPGKRNRKYIINLSFAEFPHIAVEIKALSTTTTYDILIFFFRDNKA